MIQVTENLKKSNRNKKMATPINLSPVFSLYYLFMGCLFAYSASVQLNDPGTILMQTYLFLGSGVSLLDACLFFPDWYLWLPLYACSSAVNLIGIGFTSKLTNQIALLTLCGGALLVIKVVMGAYLDGLSGFWSLDMGEKAVREKMGSGLVVISMFLYLEASRASIRPRIVYGMAMLIALSCGLSLYFFAFVMKDMKL